MRQTRWTPIVVLLLATTGFFFPDRASAQVEVKNVDQAILVATILHFEGQLKEAGSLPGASSRVVVSPAVLQASGQRDKGVERVWDARGVAAVAAAVSGEVGKLSAYRHCVPGPIVAKCSLKDADAVFVFGEPEVNGNTATVEVRMVHRSEAAPDEDEAFSVYAVMELSLENGQWRVAGARRSMIG